MATTADLLVVGGGVAGLSLAAEMAGEARVVVVEAEDQLGYHSSARSAARLHFALGNPVVRALTLASRDDWEHPEPGFSETAIAHRAPAMVFARADERPALDALAREIERYAEVEWLDAAGLKTECPVLRLEGSDGAVAGIIDRRALALDTSAYLDGLVRRVRRSGGLAMTGMRLAGARRVGERWQARFEDGRTVEAATIVNAAGAWADEVAVRCGARPIGLMPLRRTIITFDGPQGADCRGWPFAKTVNDGLYFGPEGGRLLASPMDEGPSEACDAQPEDYDVAVAAARVEERTTLTVRRIAHKWAGLRSFAPDRLPVVGERAGEQGFFWLAGQGGSGFQTAPALARWAAGLLRGNFTPPGALSASVLSPDRLG